MKKYCYIFTMIALLLSVVDIKADGCNDGTCDPPPPPFSGIAEQQADLEVPNTDCTILLLYKAREYECNGETIREIKITGWIAAIGPSCPWLSYPSVMVETAIGLLLGDPELTPFPGDFPDEGDCSEEYQVYGKACWEPVVQQYGTHGEGTYYYPCDTGPDCCKPFMVCNLDQSGITVTPLPYTSKSCDGVTGDEENNPCESMCD